FAGNLLCKLHPPVVEVAGGDALDARKLDRSPHQAGALHPHADQPEAYRVTRRNGTRRRHREAKGGFAVSVRVEHHRVGGERRARRPCHKITTRDSSSAHGKTSKGEKSEARSQKPVEKQKPFFLFSLLTS